MTSATLSSEEASVRYFDKKKEKTKNFRARNGWWEEEKCLPSPPRNFLFPSPQSQNDTKRPLRKRESRWIVASVGAGMQRLSHRRACNFRLLWLLIKMLPHSAPWFKELNNLFTRNLLSKPNFVFISFFIFFCKRERGPARSAGTSFITQDFWPSGISDLSYNK